MRLVDRGTGDYDLVGDGIVVELSRNEADGMWEFWGVRIRDERVGRHTTLITDGSLTEWLEGQRS